MLLRKFYDEGSFATLVAIWQVNEHKAVWMTYGDSVAFHYHKKSGVLENSFTRLPDFSRPPALINCKDSLQADKFRTGTFHVDKDSLLFVASDTLSQMILMCYASTQPERFADSFVQIKEEQTK